jgi:hypothetical protein
MSKNQNLVSITFMKINLTYFMHIFKITLIFIES